MKEYYENGQLKSEGEYSKIKSVFGSYAQRTGPWKEYYENGQLKIEGAYDEDGDQIGPWKEYYDNGQLKSEGEYKNGEKTGPWKEYYDNGQLFSEKEYNGSGKAPITYRVYYKNGQLQLEGDKGTLDIDGNRRDPFRSYYKNGRLKWEGHCVMNDVDNELNLMGYCRKYSARMGRLVLEGRFCKRPYYERNEVSEEGVRGYTEGPWKEYYADGRFKGYFVNDDGFLYELSPEKYDVAEKYIDAPLESEWRPELMVGTGLVRERYDSGQLKSEGKVNEEGRRVGSWKEYYENGQVKVEGGYQNGHKMGWWKEYYENGNKKSVKAYMMDQKVGTWKYYDENGEMTTQEKHSRASEERINTYSSDVLLLNQLKPGGRG